MSVLAFKALSHGAEAIPDKFFEKIPGGFFTPAEKKKIQKGRDRRSRERAERHKSEERGSKRSSRRARSPESEYTDSEYDDTDDERARNRRKKDRSRRAKSVGRSSSRSLSRGRQDRRNSRDDRDMAHAGQGEPYFPPPPASDYRPYNPQDYASTPAQADYRPASVSQPYGYPAQPAAAYPPPAGQHSPTFTNPNYAAGQRHGSVAAAKYAPGPGYAPSPVMPHASTVPPPVVAASPYPTYNPAEYSAKARDNAPPPFNRQRSNSQPSYAPYTTYIPPSEDQRLTAYDANNQPPSSRRDSTKPRREHRHRARSADTHSSSRRDRDDRRRSNSRMTKVRERFDEQFDRMDMREKGLAATVGGALAGGLAGRQLGHSKLTTLAGVAAGAFGGRTFMEQKQRSKSRGAHRSRSRSRSRDRDRSRSRRRHDDRAETPPRGLRARSKSVIDRFRSKSRGGDDRRGEDRKGQDRRDKYDERPDHGYDRGRDDEYDNDSSASEGEGEPVRSRRHRKRREH